LEKISLPLSDNIRHILIQFSFYNERNVPLGIRSSPRETKMERKQRSSRKHQGEEIIPRTQNTKIDIIEDLLLSGYVLVDAYHKERIDPKNEEARYQMVRFTFVREEHANVSDHYKKQQRSSVIELSDMCDNALWRVRAYLNPYFKDNRVVSGIKSLSINLEVRNPLKRFNGTPILHKKDDGSLEPPHIEHNLFIEENMFILE